MDPMQLLIIVALVLWILLSLLLIASLVTALPTLRRLASLLRRTDRFLERTEREIDPVLDHLRRSADDLDYITSAVRSDVESVGDTVEQATRTTRTLLELAEARAGEINGFLENHGVEPVETDLGALPLSAAYELPVSERKGIVRPRITTSLAIGL